MARTLASNPFANSKAKENALERKAERLSRKYDKENAHLKAFRDDVNDIRELLANGKIDKENAEIWYKEAKEAYDKIENKIQDEKKEAIRMASPNPYYYEDRQIRPWDLRNLFRKRE